MRTIDEAAKALDAGTTTALELTERCLDRIAQGEGPRTFIKVYRESALAMAGAMDALRRAGRAPGRFAGIPISVKDLLDIAGDATPAGSVVLADAPPARRHATVVERVLQAGFIPVGRTNMTEFAFSGLGINPHHGTPAAPWDRAGRRIPGGSSSGAAVSVSDGMAFGALGTDTGGSCRVPAAYCGVTGYKPTARRVPLDGCLPLAPSLDSIGPLAPSVSCCAVLDAVLAGETPRELIPARLSGLRLAVCETIALVGMDDAVSAAFERALAALSRAGAIITRAKIPVLEEIGPAGAKGGFAASEAFAWHQKLLETSGDRYDPLIRKRIERGARQTAADYAYLVAARARIIAASNAATADFDALIMPTTPILPPLIAALEADEGEYNRINLISLRNTAIGNFLDRCAISLPCHRDGEPPVGLMLMGETMGDARLFRIAAAVERVLAA